MSCIVKVMLSSEVQKNANINLDRRHYWWPPFIFTVPADLPNLLPRLLDMLHHPKIHIKIDCYLRGQFSEDFGLVNDMSFEIM
jgi:hypothetical protein